MKINCLPKTRRIFDAHQGMSLIELVIAISILSIISLVVTQYLQGSVSSYQAVKNNSSALMKLRLLDERLSREFRRTRYTAPVYDITSGFNSSGYEFVDLDGVTVTYSYTGNSLSVAYSSPVVSNVINDQLTAFSFNYYQSNGVTAATLAAEVKFVEWVMTLTENGNIYSLTNRVMLRGQP